jgi:hypothetical protein
VADAHVPAQLLLFEKAAPTQKPGGYGTGRQWRPLDQALALLWQAGAWREELIQLLLLLAERPLKQPQRRLHQLPWTLPVPLRVHGHYTRAEIEAAYCFSSRRLRLRRSLRLWRAQHRRHLDPPRNGSTIAS